MISTPARGSRAATGPSAAAVAAARGGCSASAVPATMVSGAVDGGPYVGPTPVKEEADASAEKSRSDLYHFFLLFVIFISNYQVYILKYLQCKFMLASLLAIGHISDRIYGRWSVSVRRTGRASCARSG